ncbi:MAG: Hsp20/alpha crystallin family protein [Patescibacteria group bacterium]|nr:Hsp20/alpha crystallin family protein [Patescibacteria group bacterium]
MASFLNKLSGIKEEEQEKEVQSVNRESSQAPESTDERDIAAEKNTKQEKDWLDENYEGQLSVDVYGTNDEIIVVSTIAGVKPDAIDISINNDMLTIRGERSQEKEEHVDDYYYQECYWGGFSRSIILPVEVEADQVSASLKNGVLTVRLPRSRKSKSISVKVREE